MTTLTAYVETSIDVRERQCRADAAEHREHTDAETQQRGDTGGEDDHEQDEREWQ